MACQPSSCICNAAMATHAPSHLGAIELHRGECGHALAIFVLEDHVAEPCGGKASTRVISGHARIGGARIGVRAVGAAALFWCRRAWRGRRVWPAWRGLATKRGAGAASSCPALDRPAAARQRGRPAGRGRPKGGCRHFAQDRRTPPPPYQPAQADRDAPPSRRARSA